MLSNIFERNKFIEATQTKTKEDKRRVIQNMVSYLESSPSRKFFPFMKYLNVNRTNEVLQQQMIKFCEVQQKRFWNCLNLEENCGTRKSLIREM
uniref:Uncharacterized protein n=1 Tax=Octopus bimaculoides TaxID=37653 RepID=A0A0L8FZF2_OCTBM